MRRTADSNRVLVVRTSNQGSQAFVAGRLTEAVAAYEEAARNLGIGDDDIAPRVYENLGLAYFNLGRYGPACKAFLRSLDGRPTSREQPLRFLIPCLVGLGRPNDALQMLQVYEDGFGPYPGEWSRMQLEGLIAERRQELRRTCVC